MVEINPVVFFSLWYKIFTLLSKFVTIFTDSELTNEKLDYKLVKCKINTEPV
jgi:hypothetical protein